MGVGIQISRGTNYERLFTIVDVPGKFQSKPFHFAILVLQGCTLSPLLFSIVMQLSAVVT